MFVCAVVLLCWVYWVCVVNVHCTYVGGISEDQLRPLVLGIAHGLAARMLYHVALVLC
jgi:hypothetical protein